MAEYSLEVIPVGISGLCEIGMRDISFLCLLTLIHHFVVLDLAALLFIRSSDKASIVHIC